MSSFEDQGQFFFKTAPSIAATVEQTIRSDQPLEECLNQLSDCIYVKSASGVIIAANVAFKDAFSGPQSPLGRESKNFLTDTVVHVSQSSDALILSGCQFAMFAHLGHDAAGREVDFQTYKHSLLGSKHPTMAVLGITRIARVVRDTSASPKPLVQYWQAFKELPDVDRSIAVKIAQGLNASQIATDLRVSRKTVENHRAKILEQFDFSAQIDLVKLVVRLQENGYGDYNV